MNVGSPIGQYRIVKKLGAGGMGTVYLGEHMLLGRRAAIKTLLPALSRNVEVAERFFNEARATSAINDPGVVQIFDFGYHVDGTAYIVLELLEGESLASRIDRLGQLPIGDALRIARQVAASLAGAHEQGIVHRDLKPDNIFLIHDGEAQNGERTKVLDFGICKVTKDDVRVTSSGVMVGTPVYMSPEQCRGSSDGVDHRSDIYALGCVLFHMLAGRAPFEHDAPGDFIVSHMQSTPPTPSELVPALPPIVDALILRCLEKDPGVRYQTMRDLQTALGSALDRLSAPGVVSTLARPALVIGTGYRSIYDANLGGAVETHADNRASATRPAPRLKTSLLKFFAAAAVLLLAGGAVVVSRAEVGGRSAVAKPSSRDMTPDASEPARAATPVKIDTVDVRTEPDPVVSAVTNPEQAVQEKPAAHLERPKPTKRSMQPRPALPRPEVTTEDLYDSR